jgi:hypothetical protein
MFMRTAVSLLLLALGLGSAIANDGPARPLDVKAWEGPFPVCATLPARIELDPRLEALSSGSALLGDPVAYGIGLVITGQRNERTQRARSTIQWPVDAPAFAAQLREALVDGLDTQVFGNIQLEGDPPADCPWLLRARSRAVFSHELNGINLITMLHLESRDASIKPGYASHVTLFVGLEEIATLRSKRDREAAWPAIPETRVALLVADGYRVAARILSDDARERGAAPATGTTRRFHLASGGSVQRGKLVKRIHGHYVLRSALVHLVAVPDWLKEP